MPTAVINETRIPLLYVAEVEKLFARGWNTIIRWRKTKAMPFVSIRSPKLPAIRFDLEKLVVWAKEHNIEIDKAVLNKYRKRLAKFAQENSDDAD